MSEKNSADLAVDNSVSKLLLVPEYFNFAYDVVDKWAEDRTKLGLIVVDNDDNVDKRTFWELKTASNRFANSLLALGIQAGDPVLIITSRIAEWWEAVLGIMKAGAVVMPATSQLTPKDIKYRVDMGQVKFVITDIANHSKFEAVREQCPQLQHLILVDGERDGWLSYHEMQATTSRYLEPVRTRADDPCLIYFTSGTTGMPKMVIHIHSYPIGHRTTGNYWIKATPHDIHWNISDNGWAKAAWSSLFGPWNAGAAVFTHNNVGKFSPTKTLEILDHFGITTLCAPPTAYRFMVLEDLTQYDLSNLHHCVGAGEPMNAEIIGAWRQHTGLTIHDGYGQTETTILAGNFGDSEVRPGSMGKPAPGYDIAIIDGEGQPLPAGEEGDIAIRVVPHRPVGLFREYWGDPEATSSRFFGDWYLTGDRAYQDEDGYLWFVGRADDVILSAGYRIGPFEVESALLEHPAVIESAVIASPDDIRGEIVKAFVVLGADYQGSPELVKDIQNFVKKITAPYKYPRDIEFVTELPKTVSGKIRRIELRERERQRKKTL